MMNQYPMWKNVLIILIIAVGAFYALPNIYDQDPSIEITASRDRQVDQVLFDSLKQKLDGQQVVYKKMQLLENKIRIRFKTPELQLKGQAALVPLLPDGYTQAHRRLHSEDLP